MGDLPSVNGFGYSEIAYDPKAGRFTLPGPMYGKLGGVSHARMTLDPLGRFVELRNEESFGKLAGRILAAAPGLPPETAAALLTDYLALSTDVSIDQNMRLVVPKQMRACLDDDTELALVAVGDAVRIWSVAAFRRSEAERRAALARDYSKYVNVLLGLPAGSPAPAAAATDTGANG